MIDVIFYVNSASVKAMDDEQREYFAKNFTVNYKTIKRNGFALVIGIVSNIGVIDSALKALEKQGFTPELYLLWTKDHKKDGRRRLYGEIVKREWNAETEEYDETVELMKDEDGNDIPLRYPLGRTVKNPHNAEEQMPVKQAILEMIPEVADGIDENEDPIMRPTTENDLDRIIPSYSGWGKRHFG